ncbi:hypothetical protein AMAG_17160 [Allomyces macrogynus ATCC 38327]|uniref:Uncharacterized protein n=1 Tax=Allomyces macrogynus (strain ATCC 38327) TaxID=578462 RepID=A0A0L0TE21_ALLM3|nr:hypothetical protein AMAG_17160 [Allomyces macrogynus ATCC 38327]|eukprot:KNE72925.1 hypothetical protein AMAG_17160 [Allomyces macrogynus ATCC 38327]
MVVVELAAAALARTTLAHITDLLTALVALQAALETTKDNQQLLDVLVRRSKNLHDTLARAASLSGGVLPQHLQGPAQLLLDTLQHVRDMTAKMAGASKLKKLLSADDFHDELVEAGNTLTGVAGDLQLAVQVHGLAMKGASGPAVPLAMKPAVAVPVLPPLQQQQQQRPTATPVPVARPSQPQRPTASPQPPRPATTAQQQMQPQQQQQQQQQHRPPTVLQEQLAVPQRPTRPTAPTRPVQRPTTLQVPRASTVAVAAPNAPMSPTSLTNGSAPLPGAWPGTATGSGTAVPARPAGGR